MRANIIQIGNSRGLIIPSMLLRRLRLSLKSTVDISVEDEKIIIKAEPRQGWADAAREMHCAGDDASLLPDIIENENIISEWEWEK